MIFATVSLFFLDSKLVLMFVKSRSLKITIKFGNILISSCAYGRRTALVSWEKLELTLLILK